MPTCLYPPVAIPPTYSVYFPIPNAYSKAGALLPTLSPYPPSIVKSSFLSFTNSKSDWNSCYIKFIGNFFKKWKFFSAFHNLGTRFVLPTTDCFGTHTHCFLSYKCHCVPVFSCILVISFFKVSGTFFGLINASVNPSSLHKSIALM